MHKVVKSIGLSLVVMLGISGAYSTAHAQQRQPATKTPYTPPKPNYNQLKHDAALETQKLNEKVQLDYLPDFTGKTLYMGGTLHERKDGPTYIQHFNAEATADQVLDWYRNVLASNRWQITADRERTILATREGNTVALIVNPVKMPKFNSQFEVSYFAIRKKQ